MSASLAEKRISPSEYLAFALAKSSGQEDSSSTDYENVRLVVEGNVNLCSYEKRSRVKILPSAAIQGKLLAQHCLDLETVNCSVSESAHFDGSGLAETGISFSVGGTLEARDCKNIRTLRGDFPLAVCLEDSGVEWLGKEFSCFGDLFIDRCASLNSLDCIIGGNLHAEKSSLRELGESFNCSGDINLSYCRNLKKIGAIKGNPRDVRLTHSGIEAIGNGFSCRGNLVLTDVDHLETLSATTGHCVEIESAPRLYSVSVQAMGKVDVAFCPQLRSVDFKAPSAAIFHACGMGEFSPTSFSGDLTVRECENFRSIGGKWSTDVTLVELRSLSEIAPSFHCGGDLLVRHCPDLESLGGHVGGTATLSRVGSLAAIPSSFSTGRNLVLPCNESKIKTLGCRVGREFIMTSCRSKFSTTPSFHVGSDALFRECSGLENLRGRIDGNTSLLMGTGIKKVGADFECGHHLIIEGCQRLEILNCRVGGNALVENSSLQKTGPAFCCAGRLSIIQVTGLRELRGRIGSDLTFSSPPQRLEDIDVNLEFQNNPKPAKSKPAHLPRASSLVVRATSPDPNTAPLSRHHSP